MEKNIAVILDDNITINKHQLFSPKGRKKDKSVTCVFIKKHNKAAPSVIN